MKRFLTLPYILAASLAVLLIIALAVLLPITFGQSHTIAKQKHTISAQKDVIQKERYNHEQCKLQSEAYFNANGEQILAQQALSDGLSNLFAPDDVVKQYTDSYTEHMQKATDYLTEGNGYKCDAELDKSTVQS